MFLGNALLALLAASSATAMSNPHEKAAKLVKKSSIPPIFPRDVPVSNDTSKYLTAKTASELFILFGSFGINSAQNSLSMAAPCPKSTSISENPTLVSCQLLRKRTKRMHCGFGFSHRRIRLLRRRLHCG